MTQRKTSKEEQFMIKAYELAVSKGRAENAVDRYAVAALIGQNNKSTDNIVQNLAKNGFLRRGEGNTILLTALGIQFITENCL